MNQSCNFPFSNPYTNKWARFKPVCYPEFTPQQLDERRKAEILQYKPNSAALSKKMAYARASRGELLKKKGFAVQTDTYTNSNVFGLEKVNNVLICPAPVVNCGLTSSCNVPGRVTTLCLDPAVPLYNYIRPYVYKGGQETVSNIPTIALTQPLNMAGTRGDQQVTVTWTAPASDGGFPIVQYIVQYSLNTVYWTNYSVVSATGVYPQSVTITGLQNNTKYYVGIYAVNTMGASAYPGIIAISTYSVPSIPLAVTLTGGQDIIIPVNWSPPIDNGGTPITGYRIEYTTDITTWNNVPVTVSATSNAYIITNVNNQTIYYVRVAAENLVGLGSYSPIVSTTTLQPPSVPTNLIATPAYQNISTTVAVQYAQTVTLTWTAPSFSGGTGIVSYQLDYSLDGTNWFSISSSIPPTQTTYVVSRISGAFLPAGVKYYFRVAARNISLLGPFSTVTSATTVSNPSTPYNVTANRTDTGITITFYLAKNGGSPLTTYTVVYQDTQQPTSLQYTYPFASNAGVGVLTAVLPTYNPYNGTLILVDQSEYEIHIYVSNLYGSSSQNTDAIIVPPYTG